MIAIEVTEFAFEDLGPDGSWFRRCALYKWMDPNEFT
jgi:hypothetical protein